jgi:hypothetical protein
VAEGPLRCREGPWLRRLDAGRPGRECLVTLAKQFEGEAGRYRASSLRGRRLRSVAKRDHKDELGGAAAGGSSLATRSTNTWANSGSY